MITWVKLEPVPLKEKFFVGNVSQVNTMINQIRRSYFIPEGLEIENGGDCVLIGSDDSNEIHKTAMDNIMLNYPQEWDVKSENDSKPLEEVASIQLNPRRCAYLNLTEFLKGFASSIGIFESSELLELSDRDTNRSYFDMFLNPEGLEEKQKAVKERKERELKKYKEEREQEIKNLLDDKEIEFGLRPIKVPYSLLFKKVKEKTEIPDKKDLLDSQEEKLMDVKNINLKEKIQEQKPVEKLNIKKPVEKLNIEKPVEKLNIKKPVEPFDVAADVKYNSDLGFLDFDHFYTWMLDNSFIFSKLKSSFYFSRSRSLAIPLAEYIRSFEDKEVTQDLKMYCIKENLIDQQIFLVLSR